MKIEYCILCSINQEEEIRLYFESLDVEKGFKLFIESLYLEVRFPALY